MSKFPMIGAKECTAAKLLDLPLGVFKASVAAGELPDGLEIVPGEKRWAIDTLKKIVNGDLLNDGDEIQW